MTRAVHRAELAGAELVDRLDVEVDEHERVPERGTGRKTLASKTESGPPNPHLRRRGVLSTREPTAQIFDSPVSEEVCLHCHGELPSKRAKYCKDACRQAHRKSADWRPALRSKNAKRGLDGPIHQTPRPTPKMGLQYIDSVGEITPTSRSSKTNPLKLERVNESTLKVTDGTPSRVPKSHGQWGGYNVTLALAWVIDIGIPGVTSKAWLARCKDQSIGPLPFNKAKAGAFAMANEAAVAFAMENEVWVRTVKDPIKHLHHLQAELVDGPPMEVAK